MVRKNLIKVVFLLSCALITYFYYVDINNKSLQEEMIENNGFSVSSRSTPGKPISFKTSKGKPVTTTKSSSRQPKIVTKHIIEESVKSKIKEFRHENHDGLLSAKLRIKENSNLSNEERLVLLNDSIVILFKDIVYWRLKEQGNIEDKLESMIKLLSEDFPQRKASHFIRKSAHLSEQHLHAVESLSSKFLDLKANSVNSKEVQKALSITANIINKRKKISDTFYKTQLRQKLNSKKLALDSKIEIATILKNKGDDSLARFCISYFKEQLLNDRLSETNKIMIKGIINEITQ